MPRVLVTTHTSEVSDLPVLMDESVFPANLEDDHSAAQLIERIAWAFSVVEDAGPRAGARQTTSPLRASARRSHGRRTRERRAVRACPPYSRRGKRLYSAT